MEWLILVGIIGFFGVVAIVVLMLRKRIFKDNKDEHPSVDATVIAEEELNRILEPVDEEQALAMKKYEEDNAPPKEE